MPYSYDLRDIHCFMQIAQTGSMTKAALRSNIPKATLSHRLRNLEDALSVELFTRTPKGMVPTDAGKEYYANCTNIFESCDSAASAAQRAYSTVDGKLRIAASAQFGTTIIGGAAYYITKSNPGIDFELQLYPENNLIVSELEFDCMIYVGAPPDSEFIARKIGEISYGLYASPEFVDQTKMPKTPDEVSSLDGVVYMSSGIPERWLLKKGRNTVDVGCYPRFRVNENWLAKYFAVSGSAIAYLPDFFVHYEIQQSVLVPVLPAWRSDPIPVSVLYHAQRHKNPRVSMLVNTLCNHFHDFASDPGYSLKKSVSLDDTKD